MQRLSDGTLTIEGAEQFKIKWAKTYATGGWDGRDARTHRYEASIEAAAWEAVKLLAAIRGLLEGGWQVYPHPPHWMPLSDGPEVGK